MSKAHAELLKITETDLDFMEFHRKVGVALAKDFDNFIADGIIDQLKKEGYTDAYILDRKFVLDAIQEKLEREASEC